MRTLPGILVLVAAVISSASSLFAESLDGAVVQVRMPVEDVTLFYIESKGGMTVQIHTADASVEARKMYVGDGEVAVELKADSLNGIFFQGDTKLLNGHQFKANSTVKVLPGYRKASSLQAGDIYVTLPGVTFELPARSR